MAAGQSLRYAYDAGGRLRTLTHPDGTQTAYTYDKAGNRQSVTRPDGVSTAYTYDALNRLSAHEHR